MTKNSSFAVAALAAATIFAFATAAVAEEKHPEINASEKSLHEAIDHLIQAPGDFGGHKKIAMDHMQQAMDELKKAKEADKK